MVHTECTDHKQNYSTANKVEVAYIGSEIDIPEHAEITPTMTNYFVLYHNYEAMGYEPKPNGNTMSFYTTKKLVENAIGGECYMIVGIGKKSKEYYLWSWLAIEKVEKENDLFIGSGPSRTFHKDILLNHQPEFAEFKNFCGNFGLGFQNINKSKFKDVLLALVKQQEPTSK
jgi:hypothetical protein